jgi:hypothetical protein
MHIYIYIYIYTHTHILHAGELGHVLLANRNRRLNQGEESSEPQASSAAPNTEVAGNTHADGVESNENARARHEQGQENRARDAQQQSKSGSAGKERFLDDADNVSQDTKDGISSEGATTKESVSSGAGDQHAGTDVNIKQSVSGGAGDQHAGTDVNIKQSVSGGAGDQHTGTSSKSESEAGTHSAGLHQSNQKKQETAVVSAAKQPLTTPAQREQQRRRDAGVAFAGRLLSRVPEVELSRLQPLSQDKYLQDIEEEAGAADANLSDVGFNRLVFDLVNQELAHLAAPVRLALSLLLRC